MTPKAIELQHAVVLRAPLLRAGACIRIHVCFTHWVDFQTPVALSGNRFFFCQAIVGCFDSHSDCQWPPHAELVSHAACTHMLCLKSVSQQSLRFYTTRAIMCLAAQ
jgi:hypothetical protein